MTIKKTPFQANLNVSVVEHYETSLELLRIYLEIFYLILRMNHS